MKGYYELLDAAFLALQELQAGERSEGESTRKRTVVRQLRRALIANGVRKTDLPKSK